jgi:hypothetical protein
LLRGDITPFSDSLHHYLSPLHLGSQDPKALALAAKAEMHQAQSIAYIDSFTFATINFMMMIPLLLLVKTPVKGANPQPSIVADSKL